MAQRAVKTMDESVAPSGGHRWRSVVMTLLIIIAGVGFAAEIAVHWAERQVLTTDNWVTMVGPLPKQPVVAQALGSTISRKVLANVPVKAEIADALPPKASFLADPLAAQVQTLATKTAQQVVASDTFQTVWAGANRLAMNRLVTTARGQPPPFQQKLEQRFDLNLSGASGQLRTALGSVSARVPALQPASQKVVAVTTDLHARGDRLRTVVRTIDFLAVVLPWLIIAAVLGALAFSWSRRRTIIAIAVVFAGLILLELIGLKLARQTVLDQVQRPENLTAVAYVYDTVVTGLKSRLYWLLGAMAAIFVLCLLAGPARWAVRLRHLVRLDSLHNERFAEAWASARRWVHRYEPYLWLVALLGALVALAAAGAVTGRSVLNAGLIFLSLGALVHIIATPAQLQRREQSHGMKKARLSTMNS